MAPLRTRANTWANVALTHNLAAVRPQATLITGLVVLVPSVRAALRPAANVPADDAANRTEARPG